MMKMKTIKTAFQKIFLLIALIVEIPLCALAFFLDAVIGGIVVLFRFIVGDRKGMNNSAETMFEAMGFFIMLVVMTMSLLIHGNYARDNECKGI